MQRRIHLCFLCNKTTEIIKLQQRKKVLVADRILALGTDTVFYSSH
jgi:hypothetical protein